MFKKIFGSMIFVIIAVFITSVVLTGCKGESKGAGETLTYEEADPNDPNNGGQTIPTTGSGGLHPLFSGGLGVPVDKSSLGAVLNDETGYNLASDYDGDGIPNNEEIITSEFTADYPRIVTRISAPITMEIRISQTNTSDNLVESLEDTNTKNTIANSMEDKQYSQANQKTTPIPTKESQSDSASNSEAHGYSVSLKASCSYASFGGSVEGSYSRNDSFANSFAKSTASETTLFKDVDYVDNLDKNGVEFTNSTVKDIVKNYKTYQKEHTETIVPPNAGIVRAALYIKNLTVNMPVLVSNILCTLSFRTPAGAFLPVKTFTLRKDDYSVYEQEIYGDDEFGPYTIEITDLNTAEVKKALANGYVPQIHVVSYDLRPVMDSNYHPGVQNLKAIEETAKGRTATIKIVGTGMRDLYRVAAFDVNATNNTLSPGISLKKALFNIFRRKIGNKEEWINPDANGSALTVSDNGLKWKADAVPESLLNKKYIYNKDSNGQELKGNKWDWFETYVKTYTDEYNQVHRIETIKRIGSLKKYNPFDPSDNSSYDANELMSESEIMKMKYWVIFHNGRYFEGDINDPIWAGERYEIVCYDVYDFSQHFKTFSYTPLQSMENFFLETRWNKLTNDGQFARAKYLGTVQKGDVVHLVLDLYQSRLLFDTAKPIDDPIPHTSPVGNKWNGFNYTFEPLAKYEPGIPKSFTHSADGGSNNITVIIDKESTFAHGYDISYGLRANAVTQDGWKTVRFTTEDYKKDGGIITITRKTRDKNNVEVGRIAGGEYSVNIKAYGKSYGGVDVNTNSSSNGTVHTFVTNPESGVVPGAFSFGVMGTKNQMDVSISEPYSVKGEYYLIRYYGPLNPEYSANNQVTEKIGQAGLNTFTISNPSGQIGEPGVYRVLVFAVNDNGQTQSSTEEQYITVSYERYTSQKEYRGKISNALHQVEEALDLEVNFNDGTGWYQLRVGFDVYEQFIDCRFNSYAEYDKNRFHIFFKPPAGQTDVPASQYNVFMGGREEADVYIRTIAKPKFRDTFWLKPSPNDADYQSYISLGDGYSDPDSYLYTNNSVTGNFDNWWINNNDTDATNIETSLVSHEYGNLADVGDNNFALIDADNSGSTGRGSINQYFFAPKEHNVFIVSASLTDTLQSSSVNSSINRPTFKAAADDRKIRIYDMSSQLAESFIIYWKIGKANETVNDLGPYEDIENTNVWNQKEVTVDNYLIGSEAGKLLNENTNYIVAVVAKKGALYSNPKFWKDDDPTNNPTRNNIRSIKPYSTIPPAAPSSIELSLGPDGRSIRVANIQSPGQCWYELQWITQTARSTYITNHAEPPIIPNDRDSLLNWRAWQDAMYATGQTSAEPFKNIDEYGNPVFSPMTCWINNLLPWEHYYVTARAVPIKIDENGNEIDGGYRGIRSEEVYIETEGVPGTWAGMTAAWYGVGGYNPVTGGIQLTIPPSSLPTGTTSYTLNGLVTLKNRNDTHKEVRDAYSGDLMYAYNDTYYYDNFFTISMISGPDANGKILILDSNTILSSTTSLDSYSYSSLNVYQAVVTFTVVVKNQNGDTEEHGPFTIVRNRP